MNDEIVLIGIDCATKPNKVGVARALFREKDGGIILTDAWRGNAAPEGGNWEAVVEGWVGAAANVLIALDAPLGWPKEMGDVLASHKAGASLGDCSANDMFKRATDRRIEQDIKKIVKRKERPATLQPLVPLEVGANLIARTAHSALGSLSRLGEVSLAWEPGQAQGRRAIEVYPAATLSAYGLPCDKYKKVDQPNRSCVVEWVLDRVDFGGPKSQQTRRAVSGGDHELDAVICLLAAADFLSRRVVPPQEHERTLAEKEGWIWVADNRQERIGNPSR